jgi:hypothetical protein
MADAFREYIEAELSVMLNDLGPHVKPGSTGFNMQAIKWIEKNAASFRMKWDGDSASIVDESDNNGNEQI